MISIRDLHFCYDAHGFQLGVDELAIGQAERVAWLGASGTGKKTTLLQLVAGILRPSRGSIEVSGTNVTALSDAERRNFRISNIGLVFQEFELLDYLSVLDNVLLAYRINRSFPLTSAARETGQGPRRRSRPC